MRKIMMISLGIMMSFLVLGNVKAYKKYSVGDAITINSEKYYVIADSAESQDYVVALKEKLLTVDEINANKIGSDGQNHVNRYTFSSVGTAYNNDGYGGVAYYSSPTCGFQTPGETGKGTGCISEGAINYETSDIKYVVDKWASTTFKNNELKEVNGYKARLVEKEELRSKFYPNCDASAVACEAESATPSWLSDEHYYSTMTGVQGSEFGYIWIEAGNYLTSDMARVYDYGFGGVRPVINVNKSYLEKSTDEDDEILPDNKNTANNDNENTVDVANTLLKQSILTLIIGAVIIVIGVVIYIYNKKRK